MSYFFQRLAYDSTRDTFRAVGGLLSSNGYQIFAACFTMCAVLYFFWWIILPVVGSVILLVCLSSKKRFKPQEAKVTTYTSYRGYTTRIEGML